MTDEELLAKVAEIEGYTDLREWSPPGGSIEYRHWFRRSMGPCGEYNEQWNPLTNKAQAFDLVEKYKLDISHDDVNWGVTYWGDWLYHSDDESLPRAILQAIVEAHS